jgi:hypothetical protein
MTQRQPEERPSAAEVATELADPVGYAATADLLERASVDTGELGRIGAGRDRRSRLRVWVASVLGLLTIAALVVVLLIAPWNRAERVDPDPVIPSGVPTRLQEPLADLHDAVEGHP